MTLREKILKTFVVTIREINTHGGPKEFFRKYPVGGMYYGEAQTLADENGVEIGTQLDEEKLKECRKYSENRLLVCADWAYIKGQKIKIQSQKSLGATGNPDDAYNWGKIQGMQMNDKGIDWLLGPSIDMCFDPMMYLMAISDDPEYIANTYKKTIQGIQDQGVCATAKHFPGLGTSFINMHIAPGKNTLDFDEWMKTYGYTYKEMIKQGVKCIMTTHVTLKSYDNEYHDGYYPIATYSPKLTCDLLKGELGFDGAVVTDALVMGGMGTGDLVEETVQAFKAGADLLLWPPVEACDRIEELILSGEIPMSRLEDALSRIEKMENFRNDALKNKSYDTPDAEYADNIKLEIAKHGMCLLRNDIGLIPLSKEKYKKVLIVDATDDDNESAKLLADELGKRGITCDFKRDIYDRVSLACWQTEIDDLSERYDLVIFNLNAYFASQWGEPHMHIWASHHFKKTKKLIVNYGSPYFATEYFPEDPTYIEMNTTPSPETVRMLAERLFGEEEFEGKPLLKKVEKYI